MPYPAVVVDSLSGREVPAGPEEVNVTQPFVNYLQQKLGWDPNQMMTRPQAAFWESTCWVSGRPRDLRVIAIQGTRRSRPNLGRVQGP